MARALLYAEQNEQAQTQVLASSLTLSPPLIHLSRLAQRTLAWTAVRPQPRAKALADQLSTDALFRGLLAKHPLHVHPLHTTPKMRRWADTEALPALETVGELAHWLRIDNGYLQWMSDLGGRNPAAQQSRLQHYHRRVLVKRGGRVRLLESPKQHLKHVQRQILYGIVACVPVHEAVHGFCKGRSTLSFAQPHVGRAVVLRLDLEDFFPSLSGPRVQALFRTLGYPEHVADLLGGLCTTVTPRAFWREFPEGIDRVEWDRARTLYARTHLPQGAPSSPALANLCARRLDCRLTALAESCGAAYTRYADDLAFSGDAPFLRRVQRFLPQVAAIAAEEGFGVAHRKTRVMRQGVAQHLAGIVVNVKLNVRRAEIDQLKATLVNCIRQGPHQQNRAEHPDFRALLEGKVAYVASVNPARGARLRELLQQIRWTEPA